MPSAPFGCVPIRSPAGDNLTVSVVFGSMFTPTPESPLVKTGMNGQLPHPYGCGLVSGIQAELVRRLLLLAS